MRNEKGGRADYSGLGARVREYGWPRGLELLANESLQRGYDISTDLWPRHACWKGMLSYVRRDSALVIESGCGTNALALACDFERVDVVPTSLDVLEGIRARVAHLGAGNVNVCETAPIRSGSYNALALCEVEASYVDRNLDQLLDSLHPDGSFYASFQSPRITCPSSLRLPRVRHVEARLRARFSAVATYLYSDTVTQSFELRPIGRGARGWRSRVQGALAGYMGGTFGIVASGRDAGPSLFDEIVAASGDDLRIDRYLFAHPAGFSLIVTSRKSGRRCIIRIPCGDHSFQRARTNRDNLVLLRRMGAAPVDIPVQAWQGELRAQPFFVEQMLDGRNLHRHALRDEQLYTAVVDDATRRLIELHKATARPAAEGFRIGTLVSEILRQARAALTGDPGLALLPDIEAGLVSALSDTNLSLVFCHGDYTYDNLMFDAGGRCVTGMFDWDLSQPQGLPLIDLLYFLVTAERGRSGMWVPTVFADRIKNGFSPTERRSLDCYCAALNIPADAVMPLLILTCLSHIGIRMYNPEPYGIFNGFWIDFLRAAASVIQRTSAARTL